MSQRNVTGRARPGLVASVAIFALVGSLSAQTPPGPATRQALVDPAVVPPASQIVDVLREIRQRYAGHVDDQALADAAIQGMLESLRDPNSAYLRDAEVRQLEQQIQGRHSKLRSSRMQLERDECLYLRLPSFHKGAAEQLRQILVKESSASALCLDLRNNAGGLLTEAVKVCDLFLSHGLIVASETRDAPAKTWQATAKNALAGWESGTESAERPIVVLVNRFTASAAEIVAAALQDHRRAVLVGERTWGKGSVQRVVRLDSGAVLKLTTGHYRRPSGKPLDRTGVQPLPDDRLRMTDQELASWTRANQQERGKPSEPSEPSEPRPDRQLEWAKAMVARSLQP